MRIARDDKTRNIEECIIVCMRGMKAQGTRVKQDEGLGQDFNPFQGLPEKNLSTFFSEAC